MLSLVGYDDDTEVALSAASMVKPVANHVGVDVATASLWLSNSYTCRPDRMEVLAEQLHHLVRPPWWSPTNPVEAAQVKKVIYP